jgi:epoxyqueuosine reductase
MWRGARRKPHAPPVLLHMNIFLHICCAPCTIYPLKVLRDEGCEVTGFFYNPNIHPFTEFQRRKKALSSFARVALLPLIIDEEYDLEAFLRAALELGKDRCRACYRIRLERTFRRAAANNADAVTTTLLYSIHQRHEVIAAVAEDLSAHYKIPFLYRDFRPGWREGQAEARRLGIYRQNYCGCIFSEHERFAPPEGDKEKRR